MKSRIINKIRREEFKRKNFILFFSFYFSHFFAITSSLELQVTITTNDYKNWHEFDIYLDRISTNQIIFLIILFVT